MTTKILDLDHITEHFPYSVAYYYLRPSETEFVVVEDYTTPEDVNVVISLAKKMKTSAKNIVVDMSEVVQWQISKAWVHENIRTVMMATIPLDIKGDDTAITILEKMWTGE